MSSQPDYGKRWGQQYPGLGTEPLSIEPYLSTERFELERERVFRRTWLYVGRVEEIARPGDYFVKDIAICDASVLITRDREGALRAFHNVCTHRCSKLVWDQCGNANGWACRFHGWAFDTKGHLRVVPDEAGFAQFDKSQHGLKPVAIDTWAGFIYINLDPQPAETLAEFLAEFGEQHKSFPFHEMTQCHAYDVELNVNWKLPIESSSETYHLPVLHRHMGADFFSNPVNPHSHPVDIKLWKRHRYFALFGNMKHVPTPIEAMTYQYTAPGLPPEEAFRLPPGANPDQLADWASDVAMVFPNSELSLQSHSYLTVSAWPLAVDRVLWQLRLYFRPPTTAAQAFSQEFTKCLFRNILMEDAAAMEVVYAGLKSRAVSHVNLHDSEILLRHFYKVLEAHVR